MKTFPLALICCMSLALLSLPNAAAVEFGATFTVTEIAETVAVILNDKEAAAQVDGVYPYGTTVKTDKDSSATLELNGESTIRLAEKTEMKVQRDTDDSKIIRVHLEEGEVHIALPDLEDKYKFEVKTPFGTCRVVGTRFSILHRRLADGITEYTRIMCDEGEVIFSGPYVAMNDDILIPGSVFEFEVINCPHRRYAFIPRISVQGQDMRLAVGNNNAFTLVDGGIVKVGMGNMPDVEFVGIGVVAGSMIVNGFQYFSDENAQFLRGDEFVPGVSAEAFMEEAELLCRRCAELSLLGLTPDVLQQIAALPVPEPPAAGPDGPTLPEPPPLIDVPTPPFVPPGPPVSPAEP